MLLERDHELSVVGALAAAARGESGLLVVEGPAAGVRVLMARA